MLSPLKVLNKLYRFLIEPFFLLVTALFLLVLFRRVPLLIFLSEFWFFRWYGKHKHHEIKTGKKIKNDTSFQRQMIKERMNGEIEFSFAESRLYRFITAASYYDSYDFLHEIDADWSDAVTAILQEFCEIGDEDLEDRIHEGIEDDLELVDVEKVFRRIRIRAAEFKDRYSYYQDRNFGIAPLCYMTGGFLDRGDFEIKDRLEYNSIEKVITYEADDVREQVIVPPASSREGDVLRFLNKVLDKKNSDRRFFTNDAYIYFGTAEQMEYLMDELNQSGPFTAPDYLCLIDQSD